jgi:hypothetical protein
VRARLAAAAAVAAVALVPTAHAASPILPPRKLTEHQAIAKFLAEGKVADWVGRYPRRDVVTEADFDRATRDWEVRVFFDPAGEIAMGKVDDLTGVVQEASTGPQVAWPMARGVKGAFGGKELNSLPVWLGFCAVFLLGLADLRRPLRARNLDLLVLLLLSVSLWYFNEGRIFTSVPLAYPVLAYLLGRVLWIGLRGRAATASRPVWPFWVLAAATVFLAGFRIGLHHRDAHVIDVSYASVVGAQRIWAGEAPWGHFPVVTDRACAPADATGRTLYYIQTNGRCESISLHGDTYGPVVYESYLPGYWLLGWKGKGDDLGAARVTAVALDLLAMVGLFLVGLRFGGRYLGATLAFAWAAYPFTQYVSSAVSNDTVQPVMLIFGFWLAASPWGRGSFAALASWAKFAPLVVAPLWATYPSRRLRTTVWFVVAFALATLAAFSVLLLDPHPLAEVATFWHRTIGSQIDRESPFSLWDWRQYHAGLPDLRVVQRVLQVALVLGALAVAFVPRRKSPLQLAALTAALLIGFEIVLTHWFYLYVVWFFPFVAFAVLAPPQAGSPIESATSCEASENSRSSPVTR